MATVNLILFVLKSSGKCFQISITNDDNAETSNMFECGNLFAVKYDFDANRNLSVIKNETLQM